MLAGVLSLTDTARFRVDDPDALVTASLACPVCLRSERVRWSAALQDGYDPSVACECPDCLTHWRVYLQPLQALRLRLMATR